MKNQRGMTLVELLAVVVILAIVSAIATVVIGKIISNSRADAHLANARQVLEAGKIAHATGLIPTHDFHHAKNYTMKDLTDEGLLNEKIKNPTPIKEWSVIKDEYDLDKSLIVVVYEGTPKTVAFKVNLSIGGDNYIFDNPLTLEEISREKFTNKLKEKLNLN